MTTAPGAGPDPPAPDHGTAPGSRPSRAGLVVAILASLGGAALGAWGAMTGALVPSQLRTALSPMGLTLVFWLVLSVYWSLAARNSRSAAATESAGSRRFHLLLTNGAMLLSFWPYDGWLRPFAFQFPRVLPAWPFLAPLGVAVAAGSLLLALWARRVLGRNWSAEVAVKVGHELVREGPYRRLRHPIYTGAIGMHLGTALVSGRLQGELAVAVIVLAYLRKTAMEERNLAEQFGPAYAEYRRASWALLPGVF